MRLEIYARVSAHDQQTLPMQIEKMKDISSLHYTLKLCLTYLRFCSLPVTQTKIKTQTIIPKKYQRE